MYWAVFAPQKSIERLLPEGRGRTARLRQLLLTEDEDDAAIAAAVIIIIVAVVLARLPASANPPPALPPRIKFPKMTRTAGENGSQR